MNEYNDFAEACERIGQFIEDVYNRKRLHSGFGYVSPVEFEKSLKRKGIEVGELILC